MSARLPGLDLIRAIAVVWVMLFHSFVVGGLGEDWSWLSRYGWMGVDLFFVLSGFLIGEPLFRQIRDKGRIDFREFWIKRAFRILPAYWVMLALYFALPILRESDGIESAWKFLTFTLNFNIDYGARSTFSHAWSLCVEEHFYLVLPPLAWLLHKLRVRWPLIVLLLIAVVIGGALGRGYVWSLNHLADPGMDKRNWYVEDIYYPTWARLDGLLVGVALALLKTFYEGHWIRLRQSAGLSALLGFVVIALGMWLFKDRIGLLGNTSGWPVVSLGIGLLVFAGAATDNWFGRLRLPSVPWIAAASFSLYLSHKAMMALVDHVGGDAVNGRGYMTFAVYAVAVLVGGALLYYCVEKPFLRLRNSVLRRTLR